VAASGFLSVITDPASLAPSLYRFMGADCGRTWNFAVSSSTGTMMIDNR
jgi:hypothetical protein